MGSRSPHPLKTQKSHGSLQTLASIKEKGSRQSNRYSSSVRNSIAEKPKSILKNPLKKSETEILVKNEEEPAPTLPTEAGSEDQWATVQVTEQDLYALAQNLNVRARTAADSQVNKLKIQVVKAFMTLVTIISDGRPPHHVQTWNHTREYLLTEGDSLLYKMKNC